MQQHERYMRRCIELAHLGAGSVSPNPMVGAVIVYDDRIIGEGYHQEFGAPHAEANAIHTVLSDPEGAELLKRSTIYVSLEPCAHFGKTPPCADLIVRHEIPHVVVGCRDPFDAVNGKGIEKLKDAGIRVTLGVLEKECIELNKRFFTRIKKQRPYLILKWAQTGNGFFAPVDNSQKWITNAESKKLVHQWRSEEDAILVGKKTALIDNPQLNVREWPGKQPIRIVIDKNLELPERLHLFDQAQETIVFNALKTETRGKLKYLALEDFEHYLPQLIAYQLYLMDIQSVIIEGGIQTLQLFIKAGLWDEARVFIGSQSWDDGLKAPDLKINPLESKQLGDDHLLLYLNQN